MITIAIPIYNGAKFLKETANSIFSQTKRVDHILFVDDASNDDSMDVVQKIMAENPTCDIQYYRNEQNLGYPVNWNHCFKYCYTKYFMILHQDDMLKKDTVKTLSEFLQSHPDYALAGGYEDFVDEHGNVIRENPKRETKIYQAGEIYEFVKNHGSYIACSSVMFDMDKIRNVGFFDEDVIATDELYWPRVLSLYSIAILGESLIYRRSHKDQTEYAHFVAYEKDAIAIYEKFKRISEYEKRENYRKKILKFLRFKFSRGWIGIATNVAKQGYKIIPFKYIGRAIFINPAIILYFPKMWKTFIRLILFLILGENVSYMLLNKKEQKNDFK